LINQKLLKSLTSERIKSCKPIESKGNSIIDNNLKKLKLESNCKCQSKKFATEISRRYTIEEDDVYDKLYLKVRKLFLEAL